MITKPRLTWRRPSLLNRDKQFTLRFYFFRVDQKKYIPSSVTTTQRPLTLIEFNKQGFPYWTQGLGNIGWVYPRISSSFSRKIFGHLMRLDQSLVRETNVMDYSRLYTLFAII